MNCEEMITPNEHHLKTWPQYFQKLWLGEKTFEVRKNDRDYKAGDRLKLIEFEPGSASFSGRAVTATITYVLHGGQFGIEGGYCVLSLKLRGRVGA